MATNGRLDSHYFGKFEKDLALYGSISKGFSPPTTAEVLPSTGVISTFLEAEEGTNYELGIKGYAIKGRLYVELDGFISSSTMRW